jgi:hypothetical protein
MKNIPTLFFDTYSDIVGGAHGWGWEIVPGAEKPSVYIHEVSKNRSNYHHEGQHATCRTVSSAGMKDYITSLQ